MLHTQITLFKNIRAAAFVATGLLVALAGLFIFPIASMDDTRAANTLSETTLSMATENIGFAFDVSDPTGTFSASTPTEFTVTTNNYTGYTLRIRAKEDNENNSKLLNGEYAFNTISAASSENDFANGTWGYKPSKINSAANTDYLPAPSYAGDILDATNTANNEANTYSIGLAAKADYSLPAGVYTNTFVVTAVANPVGYQITYDKNTEDEVTNMPAAQTGDVTATDLTLSSDVPVRTSYNFTGWHDDTANIDYQPGDTINLTQTGVNSIVLKAVWEEQAQRSAKAVLGANKNLNFVYDANEYVVGETYTDNIGETEISAVYEVPVAGGEWDYRTHPEWTRSNAESANFDLSFHDFEPTSTLQWFYGMHSLSSITNSLNLNLSEVTNMSSMFSYDSLTIDGIEEWDVSNVTDMSYLFSSVTINEDPDTAVVAIDLSGWEVGNVENMSNMFSGFSAFSTQVSIGDISGWETGNVTDMSSMFTRFGGYNEELVFDYDLSGWDVSHVTNMAGMFSFVITGDYEGGSYFNIGDIGGWDVSNVTDMSGMFDSAGAYATTWYVGDLSDWEVGNVENMSTMFYAAANSNSEFDIGDLSGWDVGKVENMSGMFAYAGGQYADFDLGDLGGWDVSKVTDMSEMFRNTGGYNNASVWNIGNIGYIDDEHPGWDVGSVKKMNLMFSEAAWNTGDFYLGDLSKWDVSEVTDMSYMFRNAGHSSSFFDLGDLDEWDVSSVTTMIYMFSGAGWNATYWNIGDISGWNVTNVGNRHTDFIRANPSGSNAFVVNNQPGGWT